MDINRNNYEAWLLDLIEGSLSAEEDRKVRDFLLLNPDCAADLDELEPLILESSEISFPGKAALHKALPDPDTKFSETQFDLFSIAMLEGDLSVAQEQEYLRLLEGDDEKFREWLLWKSMRLEAESVVYERKELLKKKQAPRPVVFWISIASAAAALLIFFTLVRFDQGFNPGMPVAPEAGLVLEIPVEKDASGIPEIRPLSEGLDALKPVVKAREEAKNHLKKQQDPPEKTEKIRDTDEMPDQQADLGLRPLKLAMVDRNLMKPSVGVNYDRIETLELQAIGSRSDQFVEVQYPADGLRESYQEFVEKKNISLLSIASAGVEGINRLAGSDLSLDVSRDGKGEVKSFSFKSGFLSVDSPVKKQNISR